MKEMIGDEVIVLKKYGKFGKVDQKL